MSQKKSNFAPPLAAPEALQMRVISLVINYYMTFGINSISVLKKQFTRLATALLMMLYAALPTLYAQDVPDAEYPYRRDIEKGRYDKAEEKILRRISRDSLNLECLYAAYQLYSIDQFPIHDYDKSYRYLAAARRRFLGGSDDEVERWTRDSFSGALFDNDLRRIGTMALIVADSIRTPDGYRHYLNTYLLVPDQLRDSATDRRDRLELDIARRAGTLDMLQDFLSRRPNSKVAPIATRLRDSMAFSAADRQHTVTAYQHFCDRYPQSHLLARSTDSIYLLAYREALSFNKELYFRGYAERYPLSPYAGQSRFLADSIQYYRSTASGQWQCYLAFLDDSHVSSHWHELALRDLSDWALSHQHLEAAVQALQHLPENAPMHHRLADMVHHAYLNVSVKNQPLFYARFPHLVDRQQQQADALAYSTYQHFNPQDVDTYIQSIAPYREAYLMLQRLVRDEVAHRRFDDALAILGRYADAFGDDAEYSRLVANVVAEQEHRTNSPASVDRADTLLMRFVAMPLQTGREINPSSNLFMQLLNDDGTWSEPIELGPAINTPWDETDPMLLDDGNTLYFRSQGHGSIGPADLFYSLRLDDTYQHWSPPIRCLPQ